ncbi:unnamed protein product, partial [Ectocarpus sp. 12 AP-2014]
SGNEDSEEDFEDDSANTKKRRKGTANGKGPAVAAAATAPKKGNGRGRRGGKNKPVGRITLLSKPVAEPARRSSREKPAVVYDENAMDVDRLLEEEE